MAKESEHGAASADPSAGGGRPRRSRTTKLAEIVAKQIVDDIVTQRMQPGQRLPSEPRMMEQYDIGRTTLREALRILEVQGLISLRSGPSGGPVVSATSPADLGGMMKLHLQLAGATYQDIAEISEILEPIMAGLAATSRPARVEDELKAYLAADAEATFQRDKDWMSYSRTFHRTLAGGSRNPALNLLALALLEVFHDRVHAPLVAAEDRAEVQREHTEIAECILRGDDGRARELTSRHMKRYVSDFRRRQPALQDEPVEWGSR
jgi:DNA-binding FadR family transcriptional regulator